MKLIVGFACTRTLLTLTKTTQHFAFSQQQSIGHDVYSRLSTFYFKAEVGMLSGAAQLVCKAGAWQ